MRITTISAFFVGLVLIVGCELPLSKPEPEPRYLVSYDANGADAGTVPMDNGTYLAGDMVTVRANQGKLTKSGFSFGGWTTAADGKGITYSAGETLPMGKKNLVLYAFWVPSTHVVRFEPNGGSGTMAAMTVTEGVSTPLPMNTFSRPGYLFKGWNTDAKEGGTSWVDGSTVTLGSADLTLYAIWVPGQNTISFHANGGDGVMGNRLAVTDSATLLPTCVFHRTGYSFGGWTSLADGSGTYYADGSSLTMGTTSIVLYARWNPNTYQIGFDPNGGDGTMAIHSATFGAETTLPLVGYSRPGHTFTSWNTQPDGNGITYANGATVTMGASSLTLYARWTVNSYTVTYLANGGTGTMEVESQHFGADFSLSPVAFTRTGHQFQGWSLNANGTGILQPDKALTTMSDQPLVYYAIWAPKTYHIHFHPNGGTGTMDSQAFTYGSAAPLSPMNFTNGALLFSGWSDVAGGPVLWADGASYLPIPSDQDFYACWSSSVTVGWGPYASLVFSPAAATVVQGQSVVLNAAGGGSQWRWYVDNVLISGQTGPSFSFSSSTLGHHIVSAFTTVNGVGYSGTITLTVSQ